MDEILIPNGKRLSVAQDTLSLRELLTVVESGVSWWQQRLKETEGVNRERAAAAVQELSRILDSLVQQLAQGRETVRITTRLPSQRAYDVACPICGRGNRVGARFCIACGSPLHAPDDKTAAVVPALRLLVAARSDQGRTRANNEDAWYTGALSMADGWQATLLLVADGMGGAQAGEEASRLARETIKQELLAALAEARPDGDEAWHALLAQAVLAANRRIYTTARANREKQGMGTTLTVAVVVGNRVHLAHVGDSRAYLLNARGVTDDRAPFVQLTADHSLVARLVDIGQLTPEEARTHPQRNMLYRSLGTDPAVEVDRLSQPIEAGDVLLLCSDGLSIYVEDEELAQIALQDQLSPAQICEQFVTLANQRGGQDNITVVLARVARSA